MTGIIIRNNRIQKNKSFVYGTSFFIVILIVVGANIRSGFQTIQVQTTSTIIIHSTSSSSSSSSKNRIENNDRIILENTTTEEVDKQNQQQQQQQQQQKVQTRNINTIVDDVVEKNNNHQDHQNDVRVMDSSNNRNQNSMITTTATATATTSVVHNLLNNDRTPTINKNDNNRQDNNDHDNYYSHTRGRTTYRTIESMDTLPISRHYYENNNTIHLAKNAIQFVQNRRIVYEKEGNNYHNNNNNNNTLFHKRWRMRGIGYLYWYWDMILLAELPSKIPIQYGHNVITIRNVIDRTKTTSASKSKSIIDCHLWTIYVRVMGPEIFAGSAHAVFVNTTTTNNNNDDDDDDDDECYWEYDFYLQIPGEYIVDVKLLYYNATSVMESNCTIYDGKPNDLIIQNHNKNESVLQISGVDDDPTILIHNGFKGFKMYDYGEMCCEICSRLAPDCYYWSSPPLLLNEPSRRNNGCELYFINDQSEWIPESMLLPNNHYNNYNNIDNTNEQPQQQKQRLLRQLRKAKQQRKKPQPPIVPKHGPVYHQGHRPVYFLGCGWSFWMTLDFPCLSSDLDDRVYTIQKSFTFHGNKNDDNDGDEKHNNDISIQGRKSSQLLVPNNSYSSLVPHEELPLCTIESEKQENHIGRWVRAPWPNETECPHPLKRMKEYSAQFRVYQYDPDHPKCYYREDITGIGNFCIEDNCKYIDRSKLWYSDLHNETQFYGYWRNYDCQYVEYTNTELQQCIIERKIRTISGSGKSIWGALSQYLNQRIEHFQFYDGTDGIHIHISTLAFLHHKLDSLRNILEQMPILSDDLYNPNNNNNETNRTEFYWINSIYLSSEREHEARGPIQIVKSSLTRSILESKNNKMLNFYDMTAAFTYDAAMQMDGMHIIGPPMKMLLTKLFHHVCINTTVSSSSLLKK